MGKEIHRTFWTMIYDGMFATFLSTNHLYSAATWTMAWEFYFSLFVYALANALVTKHQTKW